MQYMCNTHIAAGKDGGGGICHQLWLLHTLYVDMCMRAAAYPTHPHIHTRGLNHHQQQHMCILRETRAFDERTRAGAGMCDTFIMLLLVFFCGCDDRCVQVKGDDSGNFEK